LLTQTPTPPSCPSARPQTPAARASPAPRTHGGGARPAAPRADTAHGGPLGGGAPRPRPAPAPHPLPATPRTCAAHGEGAPHRLPHERVVTSPAPCQMPHDLSWLLECCCLFVKKIWVSNYLSGFGYPWVSVLGMNFDPNWSSGRVRVSYSSFNFGFPDSPPKSNPIQCHPYPLAPEFAGGSESTTRATPITCTGGSTPLWSVPLAIRSGSPALPSSALDSRHGRCPPAPPRPPPALPLPTWPREFTVRLHAAAALGARCCSPMRH